MRSSLYLAACILPLALIEVNCSFIPREHVPLIIKVREYYQASTVFIIHKADLHNGYGVLPIMEVVHMWSRMLSRVGIVSLNLHFRDMDRARRYVGHTVRPLFLVILRNVEAFYAFSAATRNFKMSFAVWFVIFAVPPEEGEQDHCHSPIGNPFNVTFNLEMLVLCPGDNILREWYTIDGEHTEISELAIWKKELASPFILLTNHSLYERRSNLRGMNIRGVYAKSSAVFRMENGKPAGMMGCIMMELMEVMNFTLHVRMSNFFGVLMENGSWDGAIAELVTRRADIGISEFSMTSMRMKVLDYVTPLVVSRNHLYVKQYSGVVVQWFAYFKVFSLWVWSCVIAVILLTTILVSIIYAYSGSTRVVELVSDSFLSVWGIFCQQSLSEFPRLLSLRLAFFTTFIVAVVVSAAYSAALISFLTANPRTLPFLSFEELIHDGRYRLIVLQSSSEHEMLVRSEEELYRSAKALLMPDHTLPKSIREAFLQICTKPNLVLYSAIDRREELHNWIPCAVHSIEIGGIDTMSMVFPKGSYYTDIFNHNILKFMFNGMMNRLKGRKIKMSANQDIKFYPVKMNNVTPILTILSCGIGLGLIILFIEMGYFRVIEEIPPEVGKN